ncbi:aminodeoxychorismate synthase component I [Saccharothrix violaceirubra]|uniref:aminodeoxychorismate synthase n=1 Tax=Saccharothrix violaceirubra TaxID=413306 RepID=A0A7W7T0G6_9PSEU|nr:aminodeoxychorismate synthase component I [Saccharothrix violaceirubra]MBB4964225.1 para-aminobenzoate synthetase [Saccharothrix violaceirubra]
MRTLIVDNHDSFTFNLFQYLAEVNGREPVVVANDDPRFRLSDLRRFDNVVISPGPGRPQRAADVGLGRSVIEHADLPLLGVCLGHQALCLAHGAPVDLVPPRHGVVDTVTHTGVDLFAGLPSPLSVVRYHSLAVTSLPSTLEAVAWSADGVLMGVRDRTRPAWGVQFHPESVGTEHGYELLANFRDLSGGSAGAYSPVVTAAVVPPVAAGVVVRRVDAHPSPEAVFASLYGASAEAFWLDSASGGRFSVLGDASGPGARVARYSVESGQVTVDGVTHPGPFLDWLEADLAAHRVAVPDVPFDFHLGWVGYLGYELKAECGGTVAHRSAVPDAAFVFADRALVFDHDERCVYVLALPDSDDGWVARTVAFLATFRGVVPAPPGPVEVADLRLRHGREQYLKLIAACQEAITAGESYEVCLTNEATATGVVDPFEAYRFLRTESPAPFGALLRFGALSVLSTSPERFIRVDRTGVVESEPIKGTRPRGRTPEEDEALRAALAGSTKDRAENLMIVDLVRNDLGHCAQVGSVTVPAIFEVRGYRTVHQLVSTVRARLRDGSSAVRVVRAAFPGGSMTGAPKIRTMQIIDDLEAGPRGVYSGALGYFSASGTADFSIVIRTMVVDGDKLGFGVGGAVIALSDPVAEFEETAVKATALLRLLNSSFPGRSPS